MAQVQPVSRQNARLFAIPLYSQFYNSTADSIHLCSFIFYAFSLRLKSEKLTVAFSILTGSIAFGLHCRVLRSFSLNPETVKSGFLINEIDGFFQAGLDSSVDFGSFGDSLTGSFGIGGTVEAICTALCHFPSLHEERSESHNNGQQNHLILLPTSIGTEQLPLFRTCPNDTYATASLSTLLSLLRSRNVSLSLVAPGLSDSTIVEQFIVFKCNEKIGAGTRMFDGLGADWVVRLSANLPVFQESHDLKDDEQLLSQTLHKLAKMPPEERGIALKTLLDPNTSTFSSQFRQKFTLAIKSRLQLHDAPPPSSTNSKPCKLSSIPNQRRASQDSSTCFWAGCIKFVEKQQNFLFRVQFVAVEGQAQLPRISLENWPMELLLTGLLDSKKDSIQAGLSVGYAFRVNVATSDMSTASYLMSKMTMTQQSGSNSKSNHLACFRISQDVLIMLRVLNQEDLQFIGYLIDRRAPKTNLTPAAQAASNAINSLTALKPPLSTTLSTGIDGLSLGRRPSFDVKMNLATPSTPSRTAKPQTTAQNASFPPSYPQFIQQQQQQQQQQLNYNHQQSNHPPHHQKQQQNPQFPIHLKHPQKSQSPGKIAAVSFNHLTTAHQLLTDPQAILQKLRASPAVSSNTMNSKQSETVPSPVLQKNEGNPSMELDQSFLDSWLN